MGGASVVEVRPLLTVQTRLEFLDSLLSLLQFFRVARAWLLVHRLLHCLESSSALLILVLYLDQLVLF